MKAARFIKVFAIFLLLGLFALLAFAEKPKRDDMEATLTCPAAGEPFAPEEDLIAQLKVLKNFRR
jgi:hypothetical protein